MFRREEYEYDARDEDYLNYSQIQIIRSALEDIIERVYEPTTIDEEVDMKIRKMADHLGVYVPRYKGDEDVL